MIVRLKQKYNDLYTDKDAREKFADRVSVLSLFVSILFVTYLGSGWLSFGLAATVVPMFVYKAILSAFSNEPMSFDKDRGRW